MLNVTAYFIPMKKIPVFTNLFPRMFGQPLGGGLLLVHAGVPRFCPHLCAPLRRQATWVLVSLTPSLHCSALVFYPPCFPHLKGSHSNVPKP